MGQQGERQMAKNARLLELGPANIYLYLRPRAFLTISNAAPSVNSNVYVQAYKGGNLVPDRPGNNIRIRFVDPAALHATTDVTVDTYDITVTLASSAVPAITATANDVIKALTDS